MMLKMLRKQFFRKKKQIDLVTENHRGQSLRKRIENRTEAITFAEAGLQDHAQDLIRVELTEKAKVLVVGHEDTFSEPVLEYAVGFAQRMGYEIVALNVSPVRTESSKLEPYCDLVCQQFKTSCEEGVSDFRHACEKKAIPFSHVIKFGEVDQCIKEIHQECLRVELVVTEPESCPEEGSPTIPVFCMAR
jgi:hypothetical protein